MKYPRPTHPPPCHEYVLRMFFLQSAKKSDNVGCYVFAGVFCPCAYHMLITYARSPAQGLDSRTY
jgi:hypothetical protein